MNPKNETFASTLKNFEPRYDLRTVFDDFLTMVICSFSQNPLTGKSHDEDLYLAAIEKYKNDPIRFEFPKLLALLTNEMEDRFDSDTGYDILGEFYEQHLSRKGASQFFTPWPICKFMAQSSIDEATKSFPDRPLRILEPACGSGRMLLACKQVAGTLHEFYAVDIDMTCVKMTSINLFLSGMFRSEILCGNFLLPKDFICSYKTSFLPFGLFRIAEKENSRLWHLLQYSSEVDGKQKSNPEEWESTVQNEGFKGGDQLTFF